MSLRSLRSRQESCTYRLNRAALMRMEEGKRKAMTKEVGYYDNRTICIQVENKRNTKYYSSPSDSQIEDEASKTEEDLPLSREVAKLKAGMRPHQTRNRDNNSVRSYKPKKNLRNRSKGQPSSDKKLGSGIRRKSSYNEPAFENKESNARTLSTIQKQKSKGNRRQTTRTASAAHRMTSPPLAAHDKLGEPKRRGSLSSSPSSDLQSFVGRDSLLNKKINNRGNVSPRHKWHKVISERERKSEEEITIPESNVMGSLRMELSHTVIKESKAGSDLPKPKENRTSLTKQPFDEFLLLKQQKMNEGLYDYLKDPKKQSAGGVSGELSIEAIESRESVTKKGKTRSGRSSSKKSSRIMRPSPGSRRLYYKPVTSTVTMTSDQEEVISKWRKRLGTSSPLAPYIGSPNIASSFLRNSQILTVQGTTTKLSQESCTNPMDMNYLIPEKESPKNISLEDVGFRKLVESTRGKRTDEVFSANEEQEIFLRMEMEKTKKQIHYLEQLARVKLEKLEAIRWKKKRALEEEAALNEKLEKLLNKIQELKESESFAKLLDKQTQVFATKRIRPNIK